LLTRALAKTPRLPVQFIIDFCSACGIIPGKQRRRERKETMATEAGGMRAAEVGTHFDAVVVGAGFAGMYMLHRLRGLGLKARVFEAAAA